MRGRRSATSRRSGCGPIGDLRVSVVHESDWAHAWKAHFPVLRIGRRLVIRPTWRRHRRADGDVVVALDPGMAFGTGLHPTTRLCLAGIERWADEGRLGPIARALDVGVGSGILAIAAVKLGLGRALGVDTDPIAIAATERNAALNHVARRVRARQGSIPSREPAVRPRPREPDRVRADRAGARPPRGARTRRRGCSRPGSSRTASRRAGRLRDGRTRGGSCGDREGEWVLLEAVRPADGPARARAGT